MWKEIRKEMKIIQFLEDTRDKKVLHERKCNDLISIQIYIYTRNKEIKTFHRSRFQTFHRSGVCTRLKRCQRAAKRCLSQ